MVNMNHYEDPAIYGLTAPDGGVFYIGRTSVNALNRWWQHKYRAKTGHSSPVYVRMREIGIENTGWTIVEKFSDIPDGISPKDREAWWIAKYIEDGFEIVNRLGRDGKANSMPPEMRAEMGRERRGKPTWVAGKRGEDAGWTDERRATQGEKMRATRTLKEIANPSLLQARMDRLESKLLKQHLRDIGLRQPRGHKTVEHGTRTMWEKYKCKCQPCRDAGARRNARKRGNPDWESVTAKPIVEAEYKTHGTWNCYKHGGCRCEDCKVAARQYRLRAKEE